MATTYTQANRPIAVATTLGDDALLLRGFQGLDGISQLFRFDLDLISTDDAIDIASLLGTNVTWRIVLADGSQRYFNGLISRFAQASQDQNFTSYHAEVVPWLWLLTRTADCRIFQNKSAPDIIQQIFSENGFQDFSLASLSGSFPPREYCVQYRETAFNFLTRLMEEEGIYYFFSHENGKHTLVLANTPEGHPDCPSQATARYHDVGQGRLNEDVITEWVIGKDLRPGQYTLNDFNFQDPNASLIAQASSSDPFEVYDDPGLYLRQPDGSRLARIRLEESEAPQTYVRGGGNCRAFASGYKFKLADHFQQDRNKPYVLTRVHHVAHQPGSYRSNPDSYSGESIYSNSFECIPFSTPFRPPRLTPKPMVQGSQTAFVVGPKGEEIHTDKFGRVKVQFHWDRRGQMDEHSSCWIRVAQGWAGKQWGAMFIPRIGHEAVVDFLEGDPDRPIITGCVYNAEEMPPYELPTEMTKSTIKSYSTKGGDGFNEIRFEDKKGQEQIFIQAEKDQHIRTKNDRVEWVGHESHLIVASDRVEEVRGDGHTHFKGDHNEQVDGTVSLKAGVDYETKVGTNYGLDAGTEIYLKSGLNLVLESGTTLTLKVGSSFVNLNPAGVFISGPMVMINSGGAAGSGSGISAQLPKPPLSADTAVAGKMVKFKPPKPPKPSVYSPAAVVLKQAAMSGTPFCDI